MVIKKIVIDLAEHSANYAKMQGKSHILQTNTIKDINLKNLRCKPLTADSVSITNTINNQVTELKKKLETIKTGDELIILGFNINKLVDCPQKKQLIEKYINTYTEFYQNAYRRKEVSPQNLFKDILRKDITAQEMQELCKQYKSIIQEPDLEKYVKKLSSQLKKDMDLDYLQIQDKFICHGQNGLGVKGRMSDYLDSFTLDYYKDNPLNRHKIFGLMIHELNHAKQNEISIAMDFAAYVKNIVLKLKEIPQYKERSLNDLMSSVANQIGLTRVSDIKNKYGKLDSNSALYKQAKMYIENQNNYQCIKEFTEEAFLSYKKQPIEKESYELQDKAYELFYFLTK